MTLMLTLGTAAFGAQKTLPSGKDTGSINVTNLKPGDTVTAYQFVKADYNEYGFTGYSAINNYVKDPVAPTAQEVIDMASNAATMTVAAEKKVATGDTEVTLNGLPVGLQSNDCRYLLFKISYRQHFDKRCNQCRF